MRLATLSFLPWFWFENFIEILWPFEKMGENDRELGTMQNFRNKITECNLVDLGCKGGPFTGSNERYNPLLIEERLDCFLCNKEWGNMFLEFAAETLETWTSDRNPIMMTVAEKERGLKYNRRTFPRLHYEDS